MIKKIRYGNYLGSGHNSFPKEPVDELDFLCVLHDIDHTICGGNSIMGDKALHHRLKKVDYSKLTFLGLMFYFGALIFYTGIYPYIIRAFIMRETEHDRRNWSKTHAQRTAEYEKQSSLWEKYDYQKYL